MHIIVAFCDNYEYLGPSACLLCSASGASTKKRKKMVKFGDFFTITEKTVPLKF